LLKSFPLLFFALCKMINFQLKGVPDISA
jgi:hypothetical protein